MCQLRLLAVDHLQRIMRQLRGSNTWSVLVFLPCMLLIVIQPAYKCITAYGNMGHKEVVLMRRGYQCMVDTLILYDLYLYSII